MHKNNTGPEMDFESPMHSTVDRKLTYLFIGAGIGATVALLFAPKPGNELRRNIADATRTGIDTTLEKAKTLQTQSAEIVNTVKEKASAWYDFASAKLSSGAEIKGDLRKAVGEFGKANEALENSPARLARENGPEAHPDNDSGNQKNKTTSRKSSSIV